MNELTENQAVLNEMMEVNCFLVPEDEVSLDKYHKVPVGELASIGAGMAELSKNHRIINSTFVTEMDHLYQDQKKLDNLVSAHGYDGCVRGFEMSATGKGAGEHVALKPVEGLNTSFNS